MCGPSTWDDSLYYCHHGVTPASNPLRLAFTRMDRQCKTYVFIGSFQENAHLAPFTRNFLFSICDTKTVSNDCERFLLIFPFKRSV